MVGLLQATNNNITFYKNVKSEEIAGVELDPYYEQLATVKNLKQQIDQEITVDGTIYDNASHALSIIGFR